MFLLISMRKTIFNDNIVFSKNIETELDNYINSLSADSYYLITDATVLEKCYPIIKNSFKNKNFHIHIIGEGESNKILQTVQGIWDYLLEHNANRKTSLIMNFGGGLVTDTGAFAASVFKRGVQYINIPTTLLAQVDAAIGGKNGVNYAGAKNQIGIIGDSEKIFVDPIFLKSLSKREFMNGFAEMLKHALLFNEKHWDELVEFAEKFNESEKYVSIPIELLQKSVKIKLDYVNKDRYEKGIREALNFGHTFGHALESVYTDSSQNLKHGEAIAAGIIMELYLSNQKYDFGLNNLFKFVFRILKYFPKIETVSNNVEQIYKAMTFDKKNSGTKIRSVLLEDVGKIRINQQISKNEIEEALKFYAQLSK